MNLEDRLSMMKYYRDRIEALHGNIIIELCGDLSGNLTLVLPSGRLQWRFDNLTIDGQQVLDIMFDKIKEEFSAYSL